MKKSISALVALALLSALACQARTGGETSGSRISFGLEWGYFQNLYKYRHINIISQEGSRINDSFLGLSAYPNGSVMAKISYNLHEKVCATLCGGYAGISEGCRAYPVLLRLSFAPKGLYSEGFFSFIDGGLGFRIKPAEYDRRTVTIGDIGEGYRIRLSPGCSLDLMLSLRASYDSPSIDNPEGEGYVLPENVRSNEAEYYSVNLSIALSF